jgi:hypothetical protein
VYHVPRVFITVQRLFSAVRAGILLWVHKDIGGSHQLTNGALSGVQVARWLYTVLHFTSEHFNILIYRLYMDAQNYCYGALCCVSIGRDYIILHLSLDLKTAVSWPPCLLAVTPKQLLSVGMLYSVQCTPSGPRAAGRHYRNPPILSNRPD